jgi:hypothetical protein
MDARIVDGRKIARVTDDGKLKVLVHGRDGDDLVPVKVSEDGYLMLATVELNQGAPGQNPWPVTLSGNIMEYYGATVAQRPEATEVPVGAAYMAVNTGDVWQSNGFEWVVL